MVSTFASQQFKTTNQLGPVSVESDLPRPAWVLSGGSGFPQSKDIWGTELERPKEAAAQVSWGGSTRWVVHSEQWTPGKQLNQMAWQGGSSESVPTSCPWSSLRSSSPSSPSQAFMPIWLKPATIVPLPTKTNNREPQHLLTLCSDPYYNECFGMFWLYATLYSASHPSLTHFSLHIELTERQHTSLLQCSTLTSPALNNTIQ